MTPYEALYGRPRRSPIYWEEVRKKKLIGLKLVDETTIKIIKIRKNIQVAQSRQKRYANNRRRDLEFEVGDHVFLKITHLKGISRFGKKEKLSPQFISPFKVLERIGAITYRLALPRNYLKFTTYFIYRCYENTILIHLM